MFDPIADPVVTMGDSNPTEPPNPTVKTAPIIDDHIDLGFN